MKIIDCDQADSFSPGDQSMALGNFDGIHRGHQALIHRAMDFARQEKIHSSVLLFKQHTLEEITHNPVRHLTSLEDKLEILDQMGLDFVFLKTFDHDFMTMDKEDFLENFLLDRLRVKHLVCGKDYSYGRLAQGRVSDLLEGQERLGYEVSLLPYVEDEGGRISSSRIREAVAHGQVEEAQAMLGRPYRMTGRVVSGAQRGRRLGFPTANIGLDFPYILPADGVYLTRSMIQGKSYYGMTNIGSNPTFVQNGPVKIECHLFDFQGDLYGADLDLSFLFFEREDLVFRNAEELIDQIKKDEGILRLKIKEMGE